MSDNNYTPPEVVIDSNMSFENQNQNDHDITDNDLLYTGQEEVEDITENPLETLAAEQRAAEEAARQAAQEEGSEESTESTGSSEEGQEEGEETEEGQEEESEEGSGEGEEENEMDFEEFNEFALVGQTLAEEGLDIFGEEGINKDLTPRELVDKVKGYIQESGDKYISQQMTNLGEYAKYVNFMRQGGDPSLVEPAVRAIDYANFDLNNPEVTDDQLKGLVKGMYLRQGMQEDKANSYISKLTKEELLAESNDSVNFHKNYVKQVEQNALIQHQRQEAERKQQQIMQQQAIRRAASEALIGGRKLQDEEVREALGTIFNRNIPVNIVNPQTGQQEQEFRSALEIGLYQAVNDPVKVLMLADLINKDFSLEEYKEQVRMADKRSAFSALEGRKVKKKANKIQKVTSDDRDKALEDYEAGRRDKTTTVGSFSI